MNEIFTNENWPDVKRALDTYQRELNVPPPPPGVQATYLSYSAGEQSHGLLEMVLRGHIPRPPHFFVVNADPGMEDERSYEFVAQSKARCEEAGIEFLIARTPMTPQLNLYQQLILSAHSESGAGRLELGILPEEWTAAEREKWRNRKRMDHPAYYTRNRETGKMGMLAQKCTREFKIRPMRRLVREYLKRHFPRTSPLPRVEAWIGFAADEKSRATKHQKQEKPSYYIQSRYPLIELGMDRVKMKGYYLKHGINKPPRSVCVACFANGLAHFEDMYQNRPADWDKAVAVDDAIRDMTRFGVRDECFVSSTLIPLKDLPAKDFLRGTKERKDHQCNSGACVL